MKGRTALRSAISRTRRPWILILMALLLGMSIISSLQAQFLIQHASPGLNRFGPSEMAPPVQSILLNFVESIYVFILAPAAWQWTGDDRLQAPLLRGLLQALLTSTAFFLLIARFQFQGGWPHFPILAQMLGSLYYFVPGFLICRWETFAAERREARQRTEEARWALLKAQMSPHVLLNSLNGVAQLLRENPPAAIQGMQNLSRVFRQLLALGERPKIRLRDERQLLESYLAVEQLRLESQLRVEWDWNPELDECLAIPLALQPLVENAIKHGVAADPAGGWIRISGRREKGRLHLVIANTMPQTTRISRGTGVGLRNLRARLELAYGTRAKLELVRDDEVFRAELQLPLET